MKPGSPYAAVRFFDSGWSNYPKQETLSLSRTRGGGGFFRGEQSVDDDADESYKKEEE